MYIEHGRCRNIIADPYQRVPTANANGSGSERNWSNIQKKILLTMQYHIIYEYI